MLANYTKNIDGVVKQIDCKPYIYSKEYSDSRYSVFNDRGNILNLRLGYIIGSIGHIPKSLMDVGYGNGDFLDACKNSIDILYGNDVEPAYPLKDNIKFVKDITSVEVDVITFFDSLEHFNDIEFVKDLKCKYAVISLPWCWGASDDEWFNNWKHRKPDEHLYHFDEKSLEKFMKRMGFEIINYTNIEDKVRIDKNYTPNILTATFKKL
tara:strand:- start:1051 stop:1677 length:627 start_codon:yes stop_codon:yes gene_type:complete